MRQDRGGSDWDTKDEINFIDGLWWTQPPARGGDPNGHRQALLTGYLEGAMLREDWGAIDRETVIHHAVHLLTVKA